MSNQNPITKYLQQRPSQWNRNKSFGGPQTSKVNPPSRPLQEKPPVAVSTATKNKLGVFQFKGSNNDSTTKHPIVNLLSDDEKENTAAVKPAARKRDTTDVESATVRKQGRARLDGQPVKKQDFTDVVNQLAKKRDTMDTDGRDADKEHASKSSETIASEASRTNFPSTPAARLALPDIIGMEDIHRAVENVTPEDRIEWDQHSSNSSSFGIRRAKKRARSSSPISSPVAHGYSNPQLDPGSELWGRYSLNGSNAQTPQGTTIPALAQLMLTSSPQTSKDGTTPRSVAGFRRTTSCGTQFPKRRRVGGADDDDVFTESVNIGPSKLSVLIERVQEGLAQPKLSEVGSTPAKIVMSRQPKDSGDQDPQHKKISSVAEPWDSPPPQANGDPALNQSHSNESDYGDFDDDLDDACLLDVFPMKPESHSENDTPASNPRLPPDPPQKRPPSISAITPSAAPTQAVESRTMKVEDDEFGDSDDDLMTADLEVMLSQYDKKGPVGKVETISKGNVVGIKHQEVMEVKSDSDDEFGDGGLEDLDFDFAAADVAATQSIQQTSNSLLPSTQKVRAIQRYLVTNVVESEYIAANGRSCPEKVEDTKIAKTANLRGAWYDTPVAEKAFVHILGLFESGGRCIIDDANNILILHPDHLISTTSVGDSFGCQRRAVLQDRVKATNSASPAMVYGTILHEIFQSALLANRWDTEWLTAEIEEIAMRHIEDLYTVSLQVPQAVEYLQSKMSELQSWSKLFVSSRPKPGAIVKEMNGESAKMCVSHLLDVEEHVWSPKYGLKGNIDATVQVMMEDAKQRRTLAVPLEVKTGKNQSAAHHAQTALYNLLLSDRYDVEIAYGILYYMETSDTIRIPTKRQELIHMIMQRNQLACFVRERDSHLPPMLKNSNMCNRCYAKVPCFIYNRLADDGTGETNGLKEKFDAVVKHLTPKHKAFFLKWDDLLTKEEKETLKFRRELWTMLSAEREKLGRCFSNVIIEPGSGYEEKSNTKINRYRYILVKQDPPSGFSFLDSQIVKGEPIVISDEKGHFFLAKGYATRVQKRSITIEVDRRLHNARIPSPGFDSVNNQVFSSIMKVAPDGSTAAQDKTLEAPIQYRIDKDEFSNGMALARNNLIQIMAEGPFGSREIRSSVVDLNAPRFKTKSTSYTLTDRENINVDQRRAIQKVMSAQDYALVLGMPGTGKTTTIAHIIRALVSQGKSVLLTSYTHSAVDNILLKLKGDSIPILRLGNLAKIHADVQEFARLAAIPKASFDEIKSEWHDSPVVATSCLGINHAIFNERTFDYCIVDEASQITLPVCIGPIRLARTFILVGDHNQLPPVIQNKEALAGGMDISLFKHLSDAHPSSVVNLEHQYRMCEDIMTLSNKLIYEGKLKCGSQEVAKRRISIPDIGALKLHHHSPATLSRNAKTICLGPTRGKCWIRDLLDPDTTVSFINTDPLLPVSREESKGNRTVNPTEVSICVQLVQSLISAGVPASDIGVMTHYRSQLESLKLGLRGQSDVEMHTADRFQGRDKEVIILSLVRSNEKKSIGDLLKDWRRINVAFTRAKTKLLVVGSRETLKGNGPDADGKEEMVAQFVKLMEKKGWVYDLPVGALESHYFEDGATQVTASGVSRLGGTQSTWIKDEFGNKNKFGATVGIGNSPRRKPLGDNKENGNGQRQPTKRIRGDKPFQIPRMSVLADVVNEVLH